MSMFNKYNSKTKILILAAGLGSRLKKLTADKPKCLLNIGDKTLLEHQLNIYKKLGLKEINLVRGYKKRKINYKDLKYFDNIDYKKNNILNSIFYAKKIINGDIIIGYSDILFKSTIVKKLLKSKKDISVVVDIDWKDKYIGRKKHPIKEAECVKFNSRNEVIDIGKISKNKNDVSGEFIGMIKLSKKGSKIFKKYFELFKKKYKTLPFQRAKTFKQAYLTDMLKELVDVGIKVHCVKIKKGWTEIDTEEDYKNAIRFIQNN